MDEKQIYNKSLNDLYKEFNTNENGLSLNEVRSRLDKCGKNKLEERKKNLIF